MDDCWEATSNSRKSRRFSVITPVVLLRAPVMWTDLGGPFLYSSEGTHGPVLGTEAANRSCKFALLSQAMRKRDGGANR